MKSEPSVVEPRDLVMTLEAVMRTRYPMPHGTPQVILRGAELTQFLAFLTITSFHVKVLVSVNVCVGLKLVALPRARFNNFAISEYPVRQAFI